MTTKSYVVSGEQPVFTGHFPGNPILPGVLLLAFARKALTETYGRPCRVRRIVRQKFLAPVLPSQTVQVECVPTGSDRLPTEVACRFVNQDGVLVAKADLVVEFSS
ncbi:hypothetical protein EVC37_06490 [Methylocaldum sp. BRCS4]|nr:hypothetical protein [Methylocaldum sp. BRCS4]